MQNMHMSDQTVIQMSSGRPNTASQLEEARRKLEDDNNQKKMLRQRLVIFLIKKYIGLKLLLLLKKSFRKFSIFMSQTDGFFDLFDFGVTG